MKIGNTISADENGKGGIEINGKESKQMRNNGRAVNNEVMEISSKTAGQNMSCEKKETGRVRTYEAVSAAGYLLGVNKNEFTKKDAYLGIEVFDRMKGKSEARLIRYLCLIRTEILNRYDELKKDIEENPEDPEIICRYIASEVISRLENQGIFLRVKGMSAASYLICINEHIRKNLDNCRSEFPEDIDWLSVKYMFIMPETDSRDEVQKFAEMYRNGRTVKIRGCYVNLADPESPRGGSMKHLLDNDARFKTVLNDAFRYKKEPEMFMETECSSVYEYLENVDRTRLVVDCENSDPYRIAEFINCLEEAELLHKVEKVMLYDDVNTCPAWSQLENYVDVPVERVVIDRINDHKSSLDMKLAIDTALYVKDSRIRSVILASSDSDFWVLHATLKEVRFFTLADKQKTGMNLLTYLKDEDSPFCSLGSFEAEKPNTLKERAVLDEMKRIAPTITKPDSNDLIQMGCKAAKTKMTDTEIQRFQDRNESEIEKIMSTLKEE